MPERFTAKVESVDSNESTGSLLSIPKNSQNTMDSDIIDEIHDINTELDQELESDEPDINLSNLETFIQKNYPANKQAFDIAQNHIENQKVIGLTVYENELRLKIDSDINKELVVSKEDQIKTLKEHLSNKGKSSVEILRILISKFKKDPEISTWVENWQKFLRLHELAKTKSPKEQRLIQNIISNADYTSENAFAVSLNAIQSSTEISDQTKLSILMEFNGADVTTVNQMDSGLQFLKERKQKTEELLNSKTERLNSLNYEIESLTDKIDELPDDDPKRKELEEQLSKKTTLLKSTRNEVDFLETEQKKGIAFEVRKGFYAKLNSDGSRSIILPEQFSLKLPTNSLPFMGLKNLRTVNLSLVCSPLVRFDIMDEVFSPNLYSGEVPMKAHRDMGNFILSNLGFDTKRILSEKDIAQLNKDVSRIMNSGILPPQDHLMQLGLYSITDQSIDKNKFKCVLQFAKENRGLKQEVFSERLSRECHSHH